ncbi:hypothetical protein TNCV_4802441 [Trichonephila clavipes]|nr:hypothetical protein TNCV_4802441 [Trichonephila clavipes]
MTKQKKELKFVSIGLSRKQQGRVRGGHQPFYPGGTEGNKTGVSNKRPAIQQIEAGNWGFYHFCQQDVLPFTCSCIITLGESINLQFTVNESFDVTQRQRRVGVRRGKELGQ